MKQLKEKKDSDGHYRIITVYNPIYKYYINGEVYRYYDRQERNVMLPKIGDKTEIYIYNNEKVFIKQSFPYKIILTICGLTFLISSVIFAILMIKYS